MDHAEDQVVLIVDFIVLPYSDSYSEERRRYMAEILAIRRKNTIQSINILK